MLNTHKLWIMKTFYPSRSLVKVYVQLEDIAELKFYYIRAVFFGRSHNIVSKPTVTAYHI